MILKSTGGMTTLSRLRYKRRFAAEDGGHGGSRRRHGARGGDVEIEVPVGTEVWAGNGETRRLADLSGDGDRVIVAGGGRGGKGNARFATSTNRYPVIAEEGDPGESLKLRLELKLLADVGIIGAPNAGKSSLLAAVSGARPKVAGYPFTTIEPSLGTVELGYESFVMVDIPGLIEGAHSGAGLGHDFLRHVQRTRVLVHLIDGEKEDSLVEYRRVREELTLFDEGLGSKHEIVAVNKLDLDAVEARCDGLRGQLNEHGTVVHGLSVHAGTGLDALLEDVAQTLAASRAEEPQVADTDAVPVLRPDPVDRGVDVRKVRGGYVVASRPAERVAAMVDPGDWIARTQLMEQLRRLGVTSEVERAGAKPGDRVRIGKLEMEWQ